MAPLVFNDAKILLGGYNLSGQSNQIALDYGVEMLDDTVFGCTTRSNLPGLKTVEVSANIFQDDSTPAAPEKSYNQFLYERIGAVREVLSVAPVGNAENDRAYILRAVAGSYSPLGGAVGDPMAGSLALRAARQNLIRGIVSATGLKIASGNSVGVELGAVAATQAVFSTLHVMEITGAAGTLDVIIESDSAGTFLSPTTQLTHTQFTTARGASWQQLAGAQADTWWRANWTVAGGGTYVIFVTIAIQTLL